MIYPNYCFSTTQGSFAIDSMYAKDLGVFIFYDEKRDVFLDKDDNIVDIAGMDLFPRTGVLQAKALVDAIYRHGGKSLVKQDDYEKTLNWPNYVKTKRKNIIMSGKEIITNPESLLELFDVDKVFFKTKNKNYSQVIDIEKLINKEGNFCKALEAHQEDDFIISEVVNIVEDEFGPLEYRGFVVNGQLLNVSRVHDYLLGRVPSCVVDKMKSTIDELKDTEFPESYVVDVFICEDEDKNMFVDILECNPIVASGTYLYNSVFTAIDDFCHSCPSKSIPVEKIKYGLVSEYGFDVKHKVIPSICYELSGGFAADLLSFAFFGTASNGMYLHFDTVSNLSSIDIGPLRNMTPINSDSDLNEDSSDDFSNDEIFKQYKKKIMLDSKKDDE